MKTAIIIMSDPKSGSEEALGWLGELTKLSHPANGLYNAVRDVVQGASCGCAEVFGATEAVKSCGVPMVKDHALAGTAGLLSLRRYVAEGWNTVVF